MGPQPGVDFAERRRFLVGAGALAVSSACGGASSLAQSPGVKPDHQLVIAPISLEIAPGHVIETIGYNGTVPGPLLRLHEGREVTVAVANHSSTDDIVHWHGLHIPSNVDGAMEEGTPMVMSGEARLYRFAAKPAGTRWYHSHAMAGQDLSKSLYGGQYGFLIIEPRNHPGRYDQEVFIAMHHWEPYFVSLQDVRKGPPPDNGLEIAYKSASFNGKALGHGDPIRVREGQRVLFRLLNASATRDVMLALPGHRFEVVALDGNPVPTPQTLDALFLAPGERIDAIVTMNHPGVFVLGAVDDDDRGMGMGVVVEYAGAAGEPQWQAMAMKMSWSYIPFGRASGAPTPEPDERIELLLQKIPGGRGGFNRWTINGKSWPDSDPLTVKRGKRYRLVLHNLSSDMHPIHLHRHSFELTSFLGKPIAGVVKDVFALPGRRDAEIDFVADNPGPSLFHCHMQDHQDFGFMALVKYV
jgi:FtsP/CotA-like multicopper oxidase with cupredoxin domain